MSAKPIKPPSGKKDGPVNMSANKITNGFPDFHHKMSKKIAQLTKVIYHLNTKSDDHEYQLNTMADAYETEIDEIIQDTTAKIAKFRELVEKKNNEGKIADVVKTLSAKHNKERQKAIEEFEEFKKKAKEREELLKKESDDRIKELTNSLQQAKDEFSERITKFAFLADELEKTRFKGDEEMKGKHNREIEDLVVSYNMKYNEMLTRMLNEQEQLRVELEKRFNEKAEQMKAEEKARVAALLEEEAQKRKKALDQQKEEFDKRSGSTSEVIGRLNKDIESLKQNELVLQGKLSKANQELSEKDEIIQKVMKAKQQMEIKLEEHEKAIAALKSDISDRDITIKRLEDEIVELKKRLQEAMESHGSSHSSMLSQIEDLEKQLKLRIGEIKSLESQLSSMRHSLTQNSLSLDEKDKLMESLQNQIREKEKSIEELKKKEQMLMHDIENMKIQHKNEKLGLEQKFMEEMEKQRKAAEDKFEKLRKDQEKNVDSLSQSSSKQLSDLKQKLLEEFDKERKQLQAAIEAKKKENDEIAEKSKQDLGKIQKQIEELAENSQKGYNQLKSDMTKIIESREADIAALKIQIQQMSKDSNSSLEDMMERLREEKRKETELIEKLEQMKQKLNEEKSKGEALKTDVKDLENKIALLQEKFKDEMRNATNIKVKEMTDLKNNMEKQFEKYLAEELKKQKQEMTDMFEAEKERLIRDLKENGDKQMGTLERNLQSKIDDLVREKKSLYERISLLENEIHKKTEEIQLILSNHNTSLEKSELDKLNSLKALEALKEQEKKSLKEEFERVISNLRNDIKNREAIIEKDKMDLSQANVQIQEGQQREATLKKQMDQLKEENKTTLETMDNKHKQELDKAKQKEQQIIENLNKEHKDKMEELIKTSTQKLYQTEEQLKNQFFAERAQLLDKYDMKQKEYEQYQQQASKDFETMQNQMTEDAKRRERNLTEDHKSKMSKLIEESIEETKNLQLEFSKGQALMEERNNILEQRIRDWENKYQNRESRPEDIETIVVLQQTLAEKEALLQKTIRDMKYYKMELVNREETYNKTFGRQPTIGVINPNGNSKATVMNVGATPMQLPASQKKPNPSLTSTAKLPPLDKGVENTNPLFRSTSQTKTKR